MDINWPQNALDLVISICGGTCTAGLLGLVAGGFRMWVNSRKDRILGELVEITGRAIQLRNHGENDALNADEIVKWIADAEDLEEEARKKANELSPIAASAIEWLNRIEPWTDDKEKYISILSKVIERLQEILAANSVRT